jgi:hypothetical protein
MELLSTPKILSILSTTVALTDNPVQQQLLTQYSSAILRHIGTIQFTMKDWSQVCELTAALSTAFQRQLAQDYPGPAPIYGDLRDIQNTLVDLKHDLKHEDSDYILQTIFDITNESWDDDEDMRNIIISLDAFHSFLHTIEQ